MKNTIKENFSIISNKLINDSRISAGAKGIACYLLSKPEDWQFYMLDIKNHFKESLGQIKKYIKELEEIGFLKRTRTTTIKNGRNTFIWVYDFSIDYIYNDLNCIDTKSIDTKSIDTISIDTKDNDILIYNITNTKITNTNIKGESEEKNNQQETPPSNISDFKCNSLQSFKEWWRRWQKEDDEEFEKWIKDKNIKQEVLDKNYDALILYCESKGKQYKNYKAAFKNFILKDINNNFKGK